MNMYGGVSNVDAQVPSSGPMCVPNVTNYRTYKCDAA